MPIRRMGRPGLVGTMARTAVVAGTASAVAGGVHNRQAQRQADKAAAADLAQQQAIAEQLAAQQAAAPPPPPPAPAGDDTMDKLKELGEMKAQGLLTDEEFSAAKAKLLGL